MGAYGVGLDFRVRACIRNHISDMSLWQVQIKLVNTTHDGIHMHIILFYDAIKYGRLAGILVSKIRCWTRPQPFLGHAFTDLVQTWHTDNEWWLTDARHFFRDHIQDGRLAAISLLKYVPNHFSDTHGLNLLKLGTSTAHDGIYVHLTLFCDLIKGGRLVDWWPF